MGKSDRKLNGFNLVKHFMHTHISLNTFIYLIKNKNKIAIYTGKVHILQVNVP